MVKVLVASICGFGLGLDCYGVNNSEDEIRRAWNDYR
jgi:hypothetical protein